MPTINLGPCECCGGEGGCRLSTWETITSISVVNVSLQATMASVSTESGATGFNITNDIATGTYSLQARLDGSYGRSLVTSTGTTNNFNELVVSGGPLFVQLQLISTNSYEYFPSFVGFQFTLLYKPCGDSSYISKRLRMLPDSFSDVSATQTITSDTATHDQNNWVSTHQISSADGFYFSETHSQGSNGVTDFVPFTFSSEAFTEANALGSYTHEFDFSFDDILINGDSIFASAYYF